jgi:hypothetical protein
VNKSRILRWANLNPTAFDRYISFCLESGVLEMTDNRYRKTGVSLPAVQAINQVLAKAEELGSAIRDLGTTFGRPEAEADLGGPVVRFASSAAWDDLTRSGGHGNGFWLYPAASKWVDPATLLGITAEPLSGSMALEPVPATSVRARAGRTRRPASRSRRRAM